MTNRTGNLVLASASAILLLLALIGATERAASQVESAGVVISEVAWAGTIHSASDEWIELYNAGDTQVDLDGWTLAGSSGAVNVALAGTIAPGGFFLMERTADDTVSDVGADMVYVGGLNNSGETVTLRDAGGVTVDTANLGGGEWPAGQASPNYVSMERVSPDAGDDDHGWADNDGLTTNGMDAGGNPIQGTPRAANAAWAAPVDDLADVAVSLAAPGTSSAGGSLRYDVHVENVGLATAEDVALTLTLSSGVVYVNDDSGLSVDLSHSDRPVWQAGAVEPGNAVSFAVTVSLASSASGTVVGELAASTPSAEGRYTNNQIQAETTVLGAGVGEILIGALLYDGYELYDADEAVQLVNTGPSAIDVSGWTLGNGSRETALESALTVEPRGSLWLARDTEAFARQFGYAPDAILSPWPTFANDGGEVILRRSDGAIADSLIYKNGNASSTGWTGAPLWPYRVSGLFAEEGQLLTRRRGEVSGMPVADSNSADDWAQMTSDPVLGRRVHYPGWNEDEFFQPVVVTNTQLLTVAVAPDNAFEAVVQQIELADHSIRIETLTLENVAIGDALVAAARRGVAVTVLLEGAPAGGIDDQERYICQQLEASGASCWFMIRDDDLRIHDRYRYLHAKFMLIDGQRALVSSENLSPFSLPDDDKADGTWGRRGLLMITNAGPVVQRLEQLFEDDFAPAAHQDLLRWHETHPEYGPPPEGYAPITVTGGTTYTLRYPHVVSFGDVTSISLFHAPENLLRKRDGLLALLESAGAGDVVLVQQLTERSHWGASNSDPQDDPNPRLEAYIDAARRGATVRLMLDSFFDTPGDPLSNSATCAYLGELAAAEHLHLRCTVANPTGLGIHNKMVLLQIDGRGWIHVGSWNGTEQSTKGNREVALQAQSDAAYAFLASLFEYDWPHRSLLPLAVNGFRGPANYPLISEILYDPSGLDDAEFVEVSNPTPDTVDLGGWTVSDAVAPEDFEDARRFPQGTLLSPGAALVVSLSADSFQDTFGFLPDFEILSSRADVPDMLDDTRWGDPAAILQLGNQGDEVLLRSPAGTVVDAVTYGTGAYPGNTACPLVKTSGYSLERMPYWRDSDDCGMDFRSWPFPSPGQVP